MKVVSLRNRKCSSLDTLGLSQVFEDVIITYTVEISVFLTDCQEGMYIADTLVETYARVRFH